MSVLSKAQADAMIKEVFDPNRVNLICYKHFYSGPVKGKPEIVPGMGCPDCWKIFFISELKDCPPDKREEKLAEIEEVMAKVVELVEKGQWDLVLNPHAEIEIGTEDE